MVLTKVRNWRHRTPPPRFWPKESHDPIHTVLHCRRAFLNFHSPKGRLVHIPPPLFQFSAFHPLFLRPKHPPVSNKSGDPKKFLQKFKSSVTFAPLVVGSSLVLREKRLAQNKPVEGSLTILERQHPLFAECHDWNSAYNGTSVTVRHVRWAAQDS